MVLFYNTTMGAVDMLEKMAHECTVQRKIKQWPIVMLSMTWPPLLLVAFGALSFHYPQSRKVGHSDFIQGSVNKCYLNQMTNDTGGDAKKSL